MSIPAIIKVESGRVFLVDKAEMLEMAGKTIFPSAFYLGFLPLQQGSIWVGNEKQPDGSRMPVPHPATCVMASNNKELRVRAVGMTEQQASALLSVGSRVNRVTIEGLYNKTTGKREYTAKLKADKRQKYSTLDMWACCLWDKFNQWDFTWAQRAEYLCKLGRPIKEGALKMRAAEIGLTLGG